MESFGLERNGIAVLVESIPRKKLPVLTVSIDGCEYKVASFNNEAVAKWFVEVMEEFFDGLYKEK